MSRWILALGLGWAAFTGVRSAPFLVRDGAPQAVIVIAEAPTRMQKLAAEELQANLVRISGAELPIRTGPDEAFPVTVYVGSSAFTDRMGIEVADLEHGGYRMRSGADHLVLAGRDTDYFMDRPGGGGEAYPASRADRARAVAAWEQAHGERWSSPFLSHFKGFHAGLGVWSVDEHGSLNAVNDFLRFLGMEWYLPGELGEILPRLATIPLPRLDRTVRPEFATRSMLFYQNAPFEASTEEFLWQLRLGLNPNGDIGGHGIQYVLGHEAVKQGHPEFFALYGGHRETRSRGGKPCYSAEGLMESSLEFARLMADRYGWTTVSLMPTDGYTYFCQCDLCRGKDTPARGSQGVMSDYVWTFIDRAAAAVSRTHPGLKISNYAYSANLLPPETIERFHPNVVLGICQHRSRFGDPDAWAQALALREAYLRKLPDPRFSLWEYYLDARSGVPVYFTRNIIRDLRWLRGKVRGEGIEVFRGHSSGADPRPDPALAANHLNCWLTARLWWDPELDAEALLAEYFRRFYGPAAEAMQAFVAYCEEHWPAMRSQPAAIDAAFAQLDRALKAAGEGTPEAARVRLLAELMEPLHALRERLAVGRRRNPVALLALRGGEPQMDGRLDEAFWNEAPVQALAELKTGGPVSQKTAFQVALTDRALYFGIRCEDDDMANLRVQATKHEDNLIFDGDSVELLLETPTHSYYQIAFDPAGHRIDLDRQDGLHSTWSGEVEVVTARDDAGWTAEVRVPLFGSTQAELNPELGVSGDPPSREAPWYFNVGRVRKRGTSMEASAFSPTLTTGFHEVLKFGKLTPQ